MAGGKKQKKPAKKGQSTQAEQGANFDKMTAEARPIEAKNFKVKWPIRLAILTLSVLALSWFFESCRQIKETITFTHVALLISSTLFALFLIWVQAFWIYLEEKYKGSLKRQIVHFDRLEEYLRKRKLK